LSDDDVQTLLEIGKKEEVIEVGDVVEIVSGPFKGMNAKVINIRGEKDRREAVIQLLDASVSPIPIIISVANLKKRGG
jgi:transcription elongation factor Spt5